MDNMLTIYDLNNRDSAGSARMMREVTGYEGFLSSARFIDDENIITGSGKCPDELSINVIILFGVPLYSLIIPAVKMLHFNQKMLVFLLRCCRSPLQFFKMPTFTMYCKNQYETYVFTFSVISVFRQKRAKILTKNRPKNKVRKGLQNRLKIDPQSEVFWLIRTGNCYT